MTSPATANSLLPHDPFTLPSPIKLKSPIKFVQEASANNEVIGKEVVEGGEGVLSVANSGNNEVDGEEPERTCTHSGVGVVKSTGGEETLEHGNDMGEHREVAAVASRQGGGQGQCNNEVDGKEPERTCMQAFVGSTLTAAMPSPVKLKSPIKFLQEGSADNEVIGKEVVEGGEGVLSIANSGNNEVDGEELEQTCTQSDIGVVESTGGEKMLEDGDDMGKHREVAAVASRQGQGQGQCSNEVDGKEPERTRTWGFVGVLNSTGGEETLERSDDMGKHRVRATAALRQGQGQGRGHGQGRGQGQEQGLGLGLGFNPCQQGSYSLWSGTGTPIGDTGVTEADKLPPTTSDDDVEGKVDGKVDGKFDGKVNGTKQYSIYPFLISDTGTIGVNFTWQKCMRNVFSAQSTLIPLLIVLGWK